VKGVWGRSSRSSLAKEAEAATASFSLGASKERQGGFVRRAAALGERHVSPRAAFTSRLRGDRLARSRWPQNHLSLDGQPLHMLAVALRTLRLRFVETNTKVTLDARPSTG